jgi:hypothetical protein
VENHSNDFWGRVWMLVQHFLLAALVLMSVTGLTLIVKWSVSVGHVNPLVGKVAEVTDGVAAIVCSVYLLGKFLDEFVFGHRLSDVKEIWLDRIFGALGRSTHLLLLGVVS